MGISRRIFLAIILALLSSIVQAHPGAHVHPHRKRKRRRGRRRFWRRRTRRHVHWRTVGGHRRLVVPLGIRVGWELTKDDQIVVVKEVHNHTIVVEHANGKTEEIDVIKEDTPENIIELEGSKYEVEEDGD